MLNNADFIRRLVKGEPSRAEKILGKIVQIKNALTGKGDANKEIAFVRKAEKLYLDAIDELGGTYRDGKIHLANREEDEGLTHANGENVQVSEENGAENTAEDASGENKKSPAEGEVKWSLAGKLPDGRSVYKSDYVKGTQKSVKQAALIDLVQNVWSNKPIELRIGSNEIITAKFNPELAERSDLAKMAYGNKKGTASDKRITLNLSGDFYAIAQDARYVGMRSEKGKANPAHNDVSEWRYFVTDLIYEEDDGSHIACYMQIDVKRNDQGDWFYSFGIEKGTAPQTFLAVVTDNAATVPNNSLHQNEPIVKPDAQENSGEIKFSRKAAAFTHRDVNEMLSSVRNETLTFTLEDGTEIKGAIASKNGQELNTWLYDTLNSANLKDKRGLARQIADRILDVAITDGKQPLREAIGEEASTLVREDLALSVADFIIENAVAEDLYDSGDTAEQMERLKILRGYMHKLDLSSLKAEIEHKLGKKNPAALVWGARKNTRGLAVDTAAMELAERGIKRNILTAVKGYTLTHAVFFVILITITKTIYPWR